MNGITDSAGEGWDDRKITKFFNERNNIVNRQEEVPMTTSKHFEHAYIILSTMTKINVNIILINYPGLCYMVQKTDVDIIQLPGGRKLVRGADISFVFLFQPLAGAAAMEQHSYSIVVILPSHE
jgi:hypothetical protein